MSVGNAFAAVGILVTVLLAIYASWSDQSYALGVLDGQVQGINNRFSGFDTDLDRLDDHLDGLGARVSELQMVSGQLQQVADDVSGLQATLSTLSRVVTALQERVAVDAAIHQGTTDRLARIEEQLDALSSRLPGED